MCFNEPHECSNCWYVGQLNEHGRCEHCGSNAVISVQLIELILAGKEQMAGIGAA